MTDNITFTIVANHSPPDADIAVLLKGLSSYALTTSSQDLLQSWAFFVRNNEGKIIAGTKGTTFYGCLYIDLLWVDGALRGQGWGRKLVGSAESLGRERGCIFAAVNTMDWEALPFYQKLGYEVDFVREGFRFNAKLYFLRKPL